MNAYILLHVLIEVSKIIYKKRENYPFSKTSAKKNLTGGMKYFRRRAFVIFKMGDCIFL